MAIGVYSIDGYSWLLVLILLMVIHGYWCLFYSWLLMTIGAYSIDSY
jgi:hypothetical protein